MLLDRPEPIRATKLSDMQMSTEHKHVKRKDVKILLNVAVDDCFCFKHKNLKERRVLDHHFLVK